jgi:hypothetical protein
VPGQRERRSPGAGRLAGQGRPIEDISCSLGHRLNNNYSRSLAGICRSGPRWKRGSAKLSVGFRSGLRIVR